MSRHPIAARLSLLLVNLAAGIFYEASFGPAVISGNTLSGNCTGSAGQSLFHCAEIYLNDSQGVTISSNTVVAGTNGIGGTDESRGSTPFGTLMICADSLQGNTITLPAGGADGYVSSRTDPCPSTPWTTSNNTVHQ